jgi:hypothetical protein
MKLIKQMTFLSAFLFVVSCAFCQEVHYNYDRGTNFAAYRTYQWIEIPGGAPNVDPPSAPLSLNLPDPPPSLPAPPTSFSGGAPNFPGATSDIRGSGSEDQRVDQEVKRAVDEQLAQKGLIKVEKNADIQVVHYVAIHEEKSISLLGSAGRGGSGWWGVDSVQGETYTIRIGTLVVDLYDPARHQLIWRGDVTKTIDLKKDPDKNYKNLQKAMAKLFKNYPPALK